MPRAGWQGPDAARKKIRREGPFRQTGAGQVDRRGRVQGNQIWPKKQQRGGEDGLVRRRTLRQGNLRAGCVRAHPREITPVYGRPDHLVLCAMRLPPTASKKILFAAVVILAAIGVVSCVTSSRAIFMPPFIEGATLVGAESCVKCHSNITRNFHDATHAHLVAT